MDSSRHASSASTTTTTTSPVSNSSRLSDIVAAAAKQLHRSTNEKDSSSPRIGSTTKTHQPLLEARKKRIVEISMAELDRRLDSWFESDDLRGSRKRRRDDAGGGGGGVSVGGVGGGVVGGALAEKKKRAKRQPTKTGVDGKKLACPFAQQNPGKYAGVKTCMGPGWQNVHRVKLVVSPLQPPFSGAGDDADSDEKGAHLPQPLDQERVQPLLRVL